MPFGENKWIWIGIMAVVVAIAVILGFVLLSEPFRLMVLFDEVGDLKKADPVVWKEFTIGKVEEIQPLVDNRIGVTIRLREDYATRITHGSEFVLKRTAFLGLVGSNAIEVITPSTPGTPFARGEKVMGKITPKTSLLEDSKKWTLDSWNKLRDATSAMVEEFRTSPYKAEAEDALSHLKTLAEEGAAQVKGGLQQFV
jgi:ABC-type transporter Mla subunit MlaD